jgi:hypothetical protein
MWAYGESNLDPAIVSVMTGVPVPTCSEHLHLIQSQIQTGVLDVTYEDEDAAPGGTWWNCVS